MKTRLALSLSLALSLLAFASPARGAVTPADFAGLNDWAHPSTGDLQNLGGAGLKNWRLPLDWSTIEKNKGTYEWSGYDRAIQDAANNGVQMLMVVSSCPPWAGCSDHFQPPATAAGKAAQLAFVAAAVKRYGTQGSHWQSNAGADIPVTHWQVWNEVNEERNWHSGKPAEYLEMLKANAQTIRAADSQAKVVISGLVERGTPKWLNTWLPEFYRDPSAKGAFDVMAVHGYSANPDGFFSILDQTRRIMEEAGDGNKRLWVTEIGWSTGGPQHPFNVGAQKQAEYLQTAFDTAVSCRNRWKLDRIYWFALANGDPKAQGLSDYWGFHNGLRELNGQPKPAMERFLEHLGGKELGRAGACDLPGGTTIDFDDPSTTFPGDPPQLYNKNSLTLDFGSNEADVSFECHFDGSAWEVCPAKFSTGPLREGTHNLHVRAVDRQGNRTPTPAVFGFLIDLTPPETRVTTPQENRLTSSTFTFDWMVLDDGGAGDRYECRIDEGEWAPCAPPFTTPPGLAHGWHFLSIRAYDFAGNVETEPARAGYKVDGKPPETLIQRPSPFTAPIRFNDPMFIFKSYDKKATFECRLDQGEWAKCRSPHTLSDVADGDHLFEVRAVDQFGSPDPTPDSRAFTVDSTLKPAAPPAYLPKFPLGKVVKRGFIPLVTNVSEPNTKIKLTMWPWKKAKKKVIARGNFKRIAIGKNELRPRLTKLGKKALRGKSEQRVNILLEITSADGAVARRKFSRTLKR